MLVMAAHQKYQREAAVAEVAEKSAAAQQALPFDPKVIQLQKNVKDLKAHNRQIRNKARAVHTCAVHT